MRFKIRCTNVAHLRVFCDGLKQLVRGDVFELFVVSPVQAMGVAQAEHCDRQGQKFSSLARFTRYIDEVFASIRREETEIFIYCDLSLDDAALLQNQGNYQISLDRF